MHDIDMQQVLLSRSFRIVTTLSMDGGKFPRNLKLDHFQAENPWLAIIVRTTLHGQLRLVFMCVNFIIVSLCYKLMRSLLIYYLPGFL